MRFPVFDIKNDDQFNQVALEVYHYQRLNCEVYSRYCDLLNRPIATHVSQIPFLPISFFKTHTVTSRPGTVDQQIFTSSGTTGTTTSSHHIKDLDLYNASLDHSFAHYYGDPSNYIILALLPHYLERKGSSLVYMVDRWIQQSADSRSGFYLNNLTDLAALLQSLQQDNKKVILIGVTFALLQLAEEFSMPLPNTIIMETGGMKGMRKEIIKTELHQILQNAFAGASIHSEYGMTELLSQAYARDGKTFESPAWMRVIARDTNDPLSFIGSNKTGGLNVIDLANLESCSFIATQDLGKTFTDGTFEVLGRFDHSDIRGCNLLAVG